MLIKLKFVLFVLFSVIILSGCGKKGPKTVDNYKVQEKDTIDIKKDQYRIAEIFTGNKNQMHDLIKGPATFDIMHQGSGKFKATIKKPDGTIVAVLAEVTGDFKGKKKIDVPETTAYILDVETEGQWSVYRE